MNRDLIKPLVMVAIGALAAITLATYMHKAQGADVQGTNSPVPGQHVAQTFATLPPAVAGQISYIRDGAAGNCGDGTCTTFGTNVTGGGGSLKLLVWYNNANWTLIGK